MNTPQAGESTLNARGILGVDLVGTICLYYNLDSFKMFVLPLVFIEKVKESPNIAFGPVAPLGL